MQQALEDIVALAVQARLEGGDYYPFNLGVAAGRADKALNWQPGQTWDTLDFGQK